MAKRKGGGDSGNSSWDGGYVPPSCQGSGPMQSRIRLARLQRIEREAEAVKREDRRASRSRRGVEEMQKKRASKNETGWEGISSWIEWK